MTFANPTQPNPFATPLDRWGNPRVTLTARELEQGMQAYCRLWGIPIPKRGARLKPVAKKRLPSIRGIPTKHLRGQQTLALFAKAA